MKRCNKCGQEKDDSKFGLIRGKYRRNTCYQCNDSKHYAAIKSDTKRYQAKLIDNKRRYSIDSSAHLTRNYRLIDRKAGRDNDLDLVYVRQQLAKPCTYCGSTSKVGLDRLDNGIGHTRANCVPCCARCNYLRGDMPFNAWICLISGLKRANDMQAFGVWIGGTLRAA